jgi:hypothetical protein
MKIIYYGMIYSIIFSFSMAHATFERVRPIQYSGLSGRMIYIPAMPARTEPLDFTQDYLEPHANIVQIDEAYERNRRMRLWQLQRAIKRRYGSYNYHNSSLVEPHIGITTDTKPF